MESNLYITSYWQSLDLMQAKLDKDTADFVLERIEGAPRPRLRKPDDRFCYNIVPAWSLGRMWQILHDAGQTYDYSTDMSPQDVVDSLFYALKNYAKQINKQ